MNSAPPAIRIRGLENRFGAQIVHQGLDLDVRTGEILGVVGGSGSGKSVLMRAIIGLQKPSAGRIEIFGDALDDLQEAQAQKLRANWGVLFQNGALFTTLTVAENVMVPLRTFHRLDRHVLEELAASKIAMVGLPPDAGHKYPSELSGGMRKRAALARALALDPRLLFLDEPTAGLDPIAAAGFDNLLRSLTDIMGLTVFLITHDLDTLYTICDRIAVLAEKHVVALGSIAELLHHPHPWVQDYFEGPRGRAALAAHRRAQP